MESRISKLLPSLQITDDAIIEQSENNSLLDYEEPKSQVD